MLRRLYQRLLLGPADVPPSRDDFEVIGVFNPGAAILNGEVILLVRVAERPHEKRTGFTALPRWTPEGIAVDWAPDHAHDAVDQRVVRHKADGLLRLTFLSHLRVVRCGTGRVVTSVSGPIFSPQSELEEYGVEDPRITCLDGRFYVTYVAVSRHGVATALASTKDFLSFERHGVIFCPENKDVVLFSERIRGEYTALHRPVGGTAFARPQMWLARSTDLLHWGQHTFLWAGVHPWEGSRIGPGTPPIKTPGGWLEIYHGCSRPQGPGQVGVYSAGAMLLDLENPRRILKRTAGAFFEPTADFERSGFVPGVVFPTGVVRTDETVLVYYGAADTQTAVVEFSLAEIIAALKE
jgi:beta-1,2-mannobiose phosphorylase / 1,2-beta-oligomannan phosphorylase